MRSTVELLLELIGQVRELARVELSLARAEVGERAGGIPSSLVAVIAGAVLLLVSLGLLSGALCVFLLRFGVALDLSFLIVGIVAIGVAFFLVRSGVAGLNPSRLVPAKSISQISSLLGGL
jgi:Putative Actinobacterial Holin-X, holin superfamily III